MLHDKNVVAIRYGVLCVGDILAENGAEVQSLEKLDDGTVIFHTDKGTEHKGRASDLIGIKKPN